MDSIEEKVLKILKENINTDNIRGNITLSDSIESIGLSSIGFINTIVLLESEFGFEFDENFLDIKRFGKIQALVDFVREKSQSS